MEIKLVTMTPEWAKTILQTSNADNRKIRPNAVKKIAAAIERGDWQITHQGIAIDTNNNLQDGQHRLSAIVTANKAVQLLLTTGCDPNAFSVLDCGVNRTAADSLGRNGAGHPSQSAAGIKILHLYKKYPEKVWTNIDMPPHSQILEFYLQNKTAVERVSALGKSVVTTERKINPSAMVAFLLLCEEFGYSEPAAEFASLLKYPTNQAHGSPVLAYKNYLARGVAAAHVNLQQRSLGSIIKCFGYWYNQSTIKQFKPPAITPMLQISELYKIK